MMTVRQTVLFGYSLVLVMAGCAAPLAGSEDGTSADANLGEAADPLLYLATYQFGDVQSTAAGGKASCALTYAGHVYCWGDWNGSRRTPFKPFGTAPMTQLETDGNEYFCGVREADGIVQCLGRKTAGAPFATTPQTIPGISNIGSLAMGGDNRCVESLGRVHCWGRSTLGYTNYAYVDQPVRVEGLDSLNSYILSVGESFACAQTIGGGVNCWGMGNPMAPGNPGMVRVSMPAINGSWRNIAVGSDHACAVVEHGIAAYVYCWGRSYWGELGSRSYGVRGPTLATMDQWSGTRPYRYDIVSAGDGYSCLALQSGGVRCWGRNDQGQLGNGTTSTWLPPVHVAGISTAVEVSSGPATSCAALEDETVKCWGDNSHGQTSACGSGDNTSPVTVGDGGGVRCSYYGAPLVMAYSF